MVLLIDLFYNLLDKSKKKNKAFLTFKKELLYHLGIQAFEYSQNNCDLLRSQDPGKI